MTRPSSAMRAPLLFKVWFAVIAVIALCMIGASIYAAAYLLMLGPEGIGRAIGAGLRAMNEVSP